MDYLDTCTAGVLCGNIYRDCKKMKPGETRVYDRIDNIKPEVLELSLLTLRKDKNYEFIIEHNSKSELLLSKKLTVLRVK